MLSLSSEPMMETHLQRVIRDTKELDSELLEDTSTVRGVICVDEEGLCIEADGQIDRNCSGLVASLTKAASKVEPESSEEPIIVLDNADQTQLIIKRDADGHSSVAILKNQSTLPK